MRWLRCFAMLLLVMTLVGCGGGNNDHPLDEDLARVSLEKALQAWVDGGKPEDLKPQIIVGDPQWKSGLKLISFEIKVADALVDGSNVLLPVTCKLQEASGKPIETEIRYIVGTSPVITIFPQ